ncbi:hypothetical protein [Bradyrhizobium sp. CCGUVB23]|uniref:hypothetical protein n=1 Tax=Bradyrhizobium sp. CCGUVB23 TaxID=2949630 RepID=UPI0020B368BA|nr:hypothetical protein [Bradyrhizobium sp. CCGUVB23]MCP3468574.1 hypothetical protein [Bradyrhizobium sp. CCGUVB23]
MRALLGPTLFVTLCSPLSPACADIPTIDAAQLTQHSKTASLKVKLVPLSNQRQDADRGVHCAVSTGKKANVADPTVQPQAGAGAKAIQPYAPDMPAAPEAGAQGARLDSQTLFKSTGDVVAGINASRSTLQAAQAAFQAVGAQVGLAPTLMGAFDMNSAARLQNNLAWNGAIGSANFWVTALNACELALVGDQSRAAIAMRATPPQVSTGSAPLCPVGMIGSGTPADPAVRIFGGNGDILLFLAGVQDAARAAATAQSGAR